MSLAATAAYVPERWLTAAELAEASDIDERVLVERFGLRGKHIAAPDEHVSDMAVAAAEKLLAEQGVAAESLDAWSGRSLDDWRTFYEGGARLAEYLRHAGYDGLMLAVWADGSAIYPSALLQSTPRYDTGAFFASAQDPVQKDLLELLLRLFDREDLQLIPMLDFSSPLPELEAVLRAGGPEAEGIEWIGADGAPLCGTRPPRRGLAPYYNLLHPRVQEAMLRSWESRAWERIE